MDTLPPPCDVVGVFPSQHALAQSQARALDNECLPATFVGELVIQDGFVRFRSTETGTAYVVMPVFRSEAIGPPTVRFAAIRALINELTIEHSLSQGRHLSFGYARVVAFRPLSEANAEPQHCFLLIGRSTARAARDVLEKFLRSQSVSPLEPTIPASCSSADHAPA